MKQKITRQYLNSRISRILLTSDLLTTRAMIGASSLLFAILLTTHYLTNKSHLVDLFWITFSMIHASVTMYALFCNNVNRVTFVGEAIFGFILWNYISIATLVSYESNDLYAPTVAPFAPTFIIGLATWWILSRYPAINNKNK